MIRSRASRRRGASIAVAAVAFWMAGAGVGAAAGAAPGSPGAVPGGRAAEYAPGEILVGFRSDAPPGRVQAILRDLGAGPAHRFRRAKAERRRIAIPVDEAVRRYRNDPAVRFIEPDYILHADAVPNDPSFPIQWSLQNTGQQNGVPGADIHATAAWDQVTGSSQVIVAIIDTGMDLTHPDLAGNLYTSPSEIPGNEIDDDGDGYVDDVHGYDFANADGDPTDDNGHGTHVAGIIGAVGNNGLGVSGVAWRVRLLPLKFMDASGGGTTSDAIDAVEYAIDHGASIINASWGGGGYSEALRLAVAEAGEEGVLFVAAAGNSGIDTDVYANWPSDYSEANVISVASTNRVDGLSEFSNYGATTVDLAAPGGQIVSTLMGGGYGVMSGTSMAAPHVCGALALLKTRFPAMPSATMKQVLLAATDRIPALAGITVTGGRLDVARMMEGVDSLPPDPIVDAKVVFASSDRVTIGFTATGDDGRAGTATRYDIRVATTPLDAATFEAATPVAGVGAPRPAGSAEQAEIRGLAPRTLYYVAAVAEDEFGNRSPLGNVLSFTTTGPPALGVSSPSLATTLRTGGKDALTLAVRNDGEGALDFTARAAGPAGAPSPSWLGIAPQSGSAPAGGAVGLAVSVSAAGLAGGDYVGAIHVTSNDPSLPALDVPVTLHVISAPDIDVFPTPLFFGPVTVGAPSEQSLLVQNVGFDDLHVTRLSVDNPQFTVDSTAFTLVPGDLREVPLSVAAAAPGPIVGTLSIENDDPDEASLRIPMSAMGQVPPSISVAPERAADTLRTGERADLALLVRNGGGSVLTWATRPRAARTLRTDSLALGALDAPDTASADAAGPRIASVADPGANTSEGPVAPPADLSDARVLFDTVHGGNATPWSALIGSLTARGVIVSANGAAVRDSVLDDADVYWISDGTGPWAQPGIDALAEWVRAGGSVFLNGDASSALPTFNAILAATGVPARYEAAAGAVGPTTRFFPHEITRGATVANLPGAAARLVVDGPGATAVMSDAAGAPVLVAAFVGRGRVLAATGRLIEDASAIFADNQRIASQCFDWLTGAAWLSTSPAYGRTTVGGASGLSARLDARRLTGGDYHGAIVVRSDDPEREQFLLPIDLTVIPAPDIVLSADSAAFGAVFVGATVRDTVEVENDGVAPLAVSSAAIDGAGFAVSPGAFTIDPGERQAVVVAFAPEAVAPAAATLRLRSNDPDEPERAIGLSGTGLAPPEAMAGPPSFEAALATGTTDTRLLTVGNRAGSDLAFTVRFEESDSLDLEPDGSALSGETAAPRFERSWTGLVGAPLLGASRASLAGEPDPGGPGALAAASDSLPLVVADPAGDGGVVDATELRATARDGMLRVVLRTATDIAANNFYGYISLDADQNPNTGREPSFGNPRQDVGAEYEIGLFSIYLGYVDVFDARTGAYLGSVPVDVEPREVRFQVPLAALGGDDGRMNVSGVIGNGVAATDWFPDRGHGVIGGRWLGASPDHGVVAAGGQQVVALTFDGRGLPAGRYAGNVVIECNDPRSPSMTMPATLSVSDAPSFAAPTYPVGFGDVFLGASGARDLLVANSGTLPLHVAAAIDPSGEFTAVPESIVVAPGSAGTLRLSFAPNAEGDRSALLTLTHDAPQGPATIGLAGRGVPAPVARVSPAALRADLDVGTVATRDLAVANDGGSTLSFAAAAENGAASVTVNEGATLDRDAEDPRTGGPVTLGRGGPDAFGTRWIDSDQPGGPVFDWVEIRDVGTPIDLTELDQTSDPLPIGFAFRFYGRAFTTFRVCTHGFLSFTNSGSPYLNQPLPSPDAPENLIAPFWDDLNFAQARRAFYRYDGTRLIVEFDHVPRRVTGGPYTFEAILYPSGAIVFQYLELGAPLNSATVGLQSGTRGDGLTVVFNADYLHDRMAIRLWAAPRWLSVAPDAGTVPPGGATPLVVTTDARGLFGGDYDGVVRVSSNDPAGPLIAVPVTLHATGIPDIAVSPAALAFDSLYVGRSATDTLQVTNAGTDRLRVSSIAAPGGDVIAVPDTLDLAPLQGAAVLVRFAPAAAGDRSTSLTIASDDPDGPVVIPVRAFAVAPPRAAVLPESLAVVLRAGGGAERSLVVSNSGGSDLRWSIAPRDTVDWLTVADGSGTLVPGASAAATARIDASALGDGAYESALVLSSDDPFTPSIAVPVRLRVGTVEAVADLTPATLQRGSRGESVRARIALPEGLDPARVVPTSVVLVGPPSPAAGGAGSASAPRTAAATSVATRAGGLDAVFDRAAALAVLPDGDRVPLSVEGEVEGIAIFAARDTIRVTSRPAAAPGVEFADDAIPAASALYPNAPNPFRPSTTIRFDVAGEGGRATLRVFAANGRLVRTLVAAALPPGRFVARWDGRDDAGRAAASGVYFCRLDVAGGGPGAGAAGRGPAGGGPFRATRRMLLVR